MPRSGPRSRVAATTAVATHTAATDPHGDRAYAACDLKRAWVLARIAEIMKEVSR